MRKGHPARSLKLKTVLVETFSLLPRGRLAPGICFLTGLHRWEGPLGSWGLFLLFCPGSDTKHRGRSRPRSGSTLCWPQDSRPGVVGPWNHLLSAYLQCVYFSVSRVLPHSRARGLTRHPKAETVSGQKRLPCGGNPGSGVYQSSTFTVTQNRVCCAQPLGGGPAQGPEAGVGHPRAFWRPLLWAPDAMWNQRHGRQSCGAS